MRVLPVVLLLLILANCQGKKKYHDEMPPAAGKPGQDPIGEILRFQQELNASFKDPDTSPLPDRYRKDFEGLDFFPPDTAYRVWAKLVRTPGAQPFMMPTTTDRLSEEVVYGIAQFTLFGTEYELELYQSKELSATEEYEDYLFLPFLDETNGNETYGGGRYLDLSIPEGDTIEIDFNKAYNPYCVYNKKYSCPIVPRQNYLQLEVRAGVKDFLHEP